MKQRSKLEEMYLESAKSYLRSEDYEIIKIKRKWGKKIVITIKEKRRNANLGNNKGKLVRDPGGSQYDYVHIHDQGK